MWGRLEREIRLLPQVVAVTVTTRDVVVLVEPGADAHVAAAAVESIVDEVGARHRIRIVGGVEPVATRVAPSGRRWAVVAGTAAASFAVAVGQLTGGSGPIVAPTPQAAPAVEPAVEPADDVAFVPEPTAPVTSSTARRVTAAARLPSVKIKPIDASPVMVVRESRASVTIVSDCKGPPHRGAALPRQGTPNAGPRTWSRSVLVEPHDLCSHGRNG